MAFKLMMDSTVDVAENWTKEKESDILGLHISLGVVVYDK